MPISRKVRNMCKAVWPRSPPELTSVYFGIGLGARVGLDILNMTRDGLLT